MHAKHNCLVDSRDNHSAIVSNSIYNIKFINLTRKRISRDISR